MVISRTGFNSKTLCNLLRRPNACIFLRKCERHIALIPNALNDIKAAIRAHLNTLVTRFDAELDAVVMGFRNINVLSHLGTILNDTPHIHIDVEVEFYLFKPEKGNILTGLVKKKSRDNIGCLVHDIFNVSIPLDPEVGVDVENISIGEPLTFRLTEVDFSGSLPYFRGKLVDLQEGVTSKQFQNDVKRKRNDQHQIHKKIKTEVEYSSSEEENNSRLSKINSISKVPTSILKKSNSAIMEGSPVRRISFYGDIPGTSNESGDFRNNSNEGISKKKRMKNENINVLGNGDLIGSKKKKMLVNANGNGMLECENFNEDREQINFSFPVEVKSKKKKKKKKKSKLQKLELEICNQRSVEQDEEETNDNRPKRNKGNQNLNEIEFPEQQKVKKKRKETVPYEQKNENSQYVGVEQLSAIKERQEIEKKNENTLETIPLNTEKEANFGSKLSESTLGKQKRKKEKKKDSGASEVPGIEIQDVNESSESKKKRTKNERNHKGSTTTKEKNEKENFTSEPIHSPVPLQAQEEEMHANKSKSLIKSDETNKKKKKRKLYVGGLELDQLKENELFLEFNPDDITNSTIIAKAESLKKKRKYSGDSDLSCDVLSPIKKSNNSPERLEDDSGFVTSTKIKTDSKSKISKTKKTSLSNVFHAKEIVSNTVPNSLDSLSPIKKLDSSPDHYDNLGFITSTQMNLVSPKKDVPLNLRGTTKSPSKSPKRKSSISSPGTDSDNVNSNSVSKTKISLKISPKRSRISDISARKSLMKKEFLKGSSSTESLCSNNPAEIVLSMPKDIKSAAPGNSKLHQLNSGDGGGSNSSSSSSSSSRRSMEPTNRTSLNKPNDDLNDTIYKVIKSKTSKSAKLKPRGSDSSSDDCDVPSPKDIAAKIVRSEESNSDLNVPLGKDNRKSEQQFPDKFEKIPFTKKSVGDDESDVDSSDSDLPYHMRKAHKKISRTAFCKTSTSFPAEPFSSQNNISYLDSSNISDERQKLDQSLSHMEESRDEIVKRLLLPKRHKPKSHVVTEHSDAGENTEKNVGSLQLCKTKKSKSKYKDSSGLETKSDTEEKKASTSKQTASSKIDEQSSKKGRNDPSLEEITKLSEKLLKNLK